MKPDNIEVHRWESDTAPDEAAVRKILDAEGLQPYRWSNSPGDVYGAHAHTYHKVIFVVKGSITFGLPDSGGRILLHAGDRLDLPAGISHNAVVGNEGVVCLEAHR
ncbi:MAG: cupin domain-containing protein [Desulfobacterales bacterium]|jgi:quercetin dioxygenase-like cupin family protein|nr:cupin domain-containing protein [Desulfobacterales bacterium]